MRVALIADLRNWALDGIATALLRYRDARVTDLGLDIVYQCDFIDEKGNTDLTRARQMLAKYDLLYPLSEYQARWIHSTLDAECPFITTVHAFPMSVGGDPMCRGYRPDLWDAILWATRVSTISTPLWRLLEHDVGELQRVTVGADPYIFYPARAPSPAELKAWAAARAPLRVGWVGNPGKSIKRFDLVQEACRALAGSVELVPMAVTNMALSRPQVEVGDYLRTLDVYVCMSDHEGLPTPGVEAAVCGIPIISTDVGVMREVVCDGLTGFLIEQRADTLRERLWWMVNHRDRLSAMSAAMADRAERWRWPAVVGEWMRFIEEAV